LRDDCESDTSFGIVLVRSVSTPSKLSRRAYFILFRGGSTDNLRAGTDLDDVVDLYKFDGNLRLLMMQAMDRIEVAIWAVITYHVAHNLGVFGYADPANFASSFDHTAFLGLIRREERRSAETFVAHYRTKYTSETYLPFWMAMELISFGALSKMYANLRKKLKKQIAQEFRGPAPVFLSWLHALTAIRNTCAHHGRLWNRELAVKPELPKTWKAQGIDNKRLYVIALIVQTLPHHGNWFYSVVVPFIALFPLTLAYVLIVQRAMDVRILLRMGTKYLLARATFLTIEIAIVTFVILRFVVPMMQRKEHQVLNFVLLAVCIGAVFQIFILRDSLSQQLQRWLDRKFFREAYNSEVVLRELSNQVRQLTDSGVVVDTVLLRISEVLHVSQIAILLRSGTVFHLQQALGMEAGVPVAFAEGSATVQNLLHTNQPATVYRDRPEEWFTDANAEEKALLRQINAELLLPMPGRARLIGLMTLGPKKSEEAYTPTDLRTLRCGNRVWRLRGALRSTVGSLGGSCFSMR
jgi:abortive infection bacteriophage resistance protein